MKNMYNLSYEDIKLFFEATIKNFNKEICLFCRNKNTTYEMIDDEYWSSNYGEKYSTSLPVIEITSQETYSTSTEKMICTFILRCSNCGFLYQFDSKFVQEKLKKLKENL